MKRGGCEGRQGETSGARIYVRGTIGMAYCDIWAATKGGEAERQTRDNVCSERVLARSVG
jgi:hypothetical protein